MEVVPFVERALEVASTCLGNLGWFVFKEEGTSAVRRSERKISIVSFVGGVYLGSTYIEEQVKFQC